MVEPIPFAGHVVVDDFSRKEIYMWASEAGFSTFDIQNNIARLEKQGTDGKKKNQKNERQNRKQ